AFSIGNLVNGVGRTIGSALVVRTFDALGYALGLAVFQLFFIPTGIMYWLASRAAPRDLADVDRQLRQRATAPPVPARQRPATQPPPEPVTDTAPVTETSPS